MSGSRWRQFLLMLPFFLIGIAIPVYFYGFTGDGPPQITTTSDRSAPSAAPDQGAADQTSDQRSSRRFGIVSFVRNLFEGTVDNWVSPGRSPLIIKLGLLLAFFVGGFFVVRIIISLLSGAGSALGFLIHKAAAPLFMGFLAVGSTWGIHQTVAEQYGMGWAAATVSITAAIATLFALAGVRVRE